VNDIASSPVFRPQPALAGLVLRVGLGLVLFGWGFDLLLHPRFYAHLLAGAAPVAMGLLLTLGTLLVVGLGTRLAAPIAAALLFGLLLQGRQPIGLPQNAGLLMAALALAILGPGHLALRPGSTSASAGRLGVVSLALRAGLAMTFLVYGVQKFTSPDEYRIVVGELPLGAALVQVLGAPTTVALLGAVELLLAVAVVVPGLLALGAAAQSVALLTFLATLGYPFSYPQDLGLLAAELALVLVNGLAVHPLPRPGLSPLRSLAAVPRLARAALVQVLPGH
jgi:uncharacterized membrane protein YphA (DoxX/SURF4 family)